MERDIYSEFMDICHDYNDVINKIYNLNTFDVKEINIIYDEIRTNFIETEIFLPNQIFDILENASLYNNRYLPSYWFIIKKIYQEFNIDRTNEKSSIFDYFFIKILV